MRPQGAQRDVQLPFAPRVAFTIFFIIDFSLFVFLRQPRVRRALLRHVTPIPIYLIFAAAHATSRRLSPMPPPPLPVFRLIICFRHVFAARQRNPTERSEQVRQRPSAAGQRAPAKMVNR
jgi:hypothetical protein